MRADQIEMLKDLSERLADVLLMEADPSVWSGAGILPMDLTKEQRGNRKWDKGNAMATGGVLRYVLDITSGSEKRSIDDEQMQKERDDELDSKIREAQTRAGEAMKRVMGKPPIVSR